MSLNFIIYAHPQMSSKSKLQLLAAAAGAAATAAAVATSVAGHDAAAETAGGSIAQVDESGKSVGGVDAAGSRVASGVRTPDGRCRLFGRLRGDAGKLGPQIFEEQLLLSSEAELQPSEDVIHDRLGEADVGIAGPAAGLESGVSKFL